MHDEMRIQLMMEKMDDAKEALSKTYEQFINILLGLEDLKTILNGYPIKTIEMLKNINDRLDQIEITVYNIPDNINSCKDKAKTLSVIKNLMVNFILLILGSFLGVVFYGLLLNHK